MMVKWLDGSGFEEDVVVSTRVRLARNIEKFRFPQKMNIEESIKNRLAEIFQKNSTIEKAILFGSRARGDHKKTSDIDIAVFSKDMSSKDFNLLIDEINQINTALSFDIIHYERLNKENLKNDILKDGVIIYERE